MFIFDKDSILYIMNIRFFTVGFHHWISKSLLDFHIDTKADGHEV